MLADSQEIEWMANALDGIYFALLQEETVFSFINISLQHVVDAVLNAADLRNVSDLDVVRKLLIEAGKTGDNTGFLKAYTDECNFSRILNQRLAQRRVKMASDISSIKKLAMIITTARKRKGRASLVNTPAVVTPFQPPNYSNTHWFLLFLAPIYQILFEL